MCTESLWLLLRQVLAAPRNFSASPSPPPCPPSLLLGCSSPSTPPPSPSHSHLGPSSPHSPAPLTWDLEKEQSWKQPCGPPPRGHFSAQTPPAAAPGPTCGHGQASSLRVRLAWAHFCFPGPLCFRVQPSFESDPGWSGCRKLRVRSCTGCCRPRLVAPWASALSPNDRTGPWPQ